MTDPDTGPNLEQIWKRAIMPLLDEYYYGTTWDRDSFSVAKLRSRLTTRPSEDPHTEGEEQQEDGL
jgi:hypothetical protein